MQSQLDSGIPIPLPNLADHYLQAGDDVKARSCLIQAGENSTLAFANADAIEQLKKASRIAPERASREEAFRLYFFLGKAYAALSQISNAELVLKKAVNAADEDIDKADALGVLAECAARRRANEQAFEYVQTGLRLLGKPMRNSSIGVAWDIASCNFLSLLPTFALNVLVPPNPSRRNKCLLELLIVAGTVQSCISIRRYTQTAGLVFVACMRAGDAKSRARGHAKYAVNLTVMGFSRVANAFRKKARECAQSSQDPSMLAYTRGLEGVVTYSAGNIIDAELELNSSLQQYQRLGESFYRLLICHYLRHTYEVNGQVDKEIAAAEEERRMSTITGDWEGLAWSEYGMADACARAGDLAAAYSWIEQCAVRYRDQKAIVTEPVMELTYAYVLVQDSRYEQAAERLKLSCRKQERDLVLLETNVCSYPRLVEALLGPCWNEPSKHKPKQITLLLRVKCCCASFVFANAKRYVLRIHGRYAASRGRSRKSVRLFSKAIKLSRQQGADYELARALLDRSLVSDTTATEDREEGFTILERLGATIPKAEMEILAQ